MKVVVLVASYPPVLESAGRLYSQLSESLAAAGHEVTVITEHPAKCLPVDSSHSYYQREPSDSVLNGVRVLRVSPLEFVAKLPGGKACRFALSCLLFALRGLLLGRREIVLVYSPPLFMGIAGYLLAMRHRAKLVLNVQDLHPLVLFESGAVRHPWFKSILKSMEEINYRNADAFIVYSEGNRDYLAGKAVRGKIHVIPNWVDMEELRVTGSCGRFRDEEAIAAGLLVSYVGTMQPAQGMGVIVQAAELLRSHPGIVFLIAGEGPSKAALQRLILQKQLTNVLLRPAMPAERYLRCLMATDVSLVTLAPDVPSQTIPGKLAYAMACGKAVVAAVSPNGDTARLVNQAGCGLCVASGDAAALADAILLLFNDPELRRGMGIKAAEFAKTHLSRDACTGCYERVMIDLTRADEAHAA